MKISIAMATYNGGSYLADQLESFLCQTLLPDELVVCDDGSSDNTIKILEAFRVKAPFDVRIIQNQSNLGYTKNFEKALSLCEGDIIFLSDQDDVWFCNKLEVMTEVFAVYRGVFVVQADMVLTDSNLNPSKYTQLGNILAIGLGSDTYVAGCGTAIRKQWLDLVLPIPSDVVEHDNWIHRFATYLGARMLIETPLQYYRRHGENASNSLASSTKKVSQFQAARIHGLQDATDGWKAELARIMATHERLSNHAHTLTRLGLYSRNASVLQELEFNIAALNDRINLMSCSRVKRLPKVFLMLAARKYRFFAGWKSAAKDLLR